MSDKEKTKKLCLKCCEISETKVEQKKETYPVRDRDISIIANIRYCCNCNSDIYDKELDEDNLVRAFRIYELKEKLFNLEEKRLQSRSKLYTEKETKEIIKIKIEIVKNKNKPKKSTDGGIILDRNVPDDVEWFEKDGKNKN